MKDITKDLERIKLLGGVDAIAKHIDASSQRVNNWTRRGIPAQVKIDYPDLFMSENPPVLKATTNK